MTLAQTRRGIALFLVILVTGPLALLAQPDRESRERAERLSVEAKGGVLSELWTLLVRFYTKEGSSVDPSGNYGGNALNMGHGAEEGGSSVDPSGHV
jgi:hypothetical protein